MLVYKLGNVKTTMHGGLSGRGEAFGPWPKLTFKRELAGELVPAREGIASGFHGWTMVYGV